MSAWQPLASPSSPSTLTCWGGIQNGMGTFSVILSLLPPIMLRLLSFFGFSSNRAEGLTMLHASAASHGLRAPLSSLVLLFLHVVIPSFFTIHMHVHNAAATALLAHCFEEYPGGSFFLWLQGRQQRNNRLLSDAIDSFKRAAAGQREWRQLQHLCAYELGTTYLFMLDHDAGRPWWEMLEHENQWSKGQTHLSCTLRQQQPPSTAALAHTGLATVVAVLCQLSIFTCSSSLSCRRMASHHIRQLWMR